jgi:hypothetical protein
MKNVLSLLVCLYSILAQAQFNEIFFERMGVSQNGVAKRGHYYGTETNNGVLAVRLVDSVNTEVQWVKLDLNGNYETFSAHLQNDYISPNERIIELYQIGNNQFIVTQDSASNNPEGIRIYKYLNYTQSVGVFEHNVPLRNIYFQSYYKFGKIYIFYNEQNVGLKRLKINPETLELEENLFLGSFDTNTSNSINQHLKQTHVLFYDENNMQVFASSLDKLIRINVINNIPNSVEYKNLGLLRVLGVNHSTNQVVLAKVSPSHRIKKYFSLPSMSLSQSFIQDSIDVPSISGSHIFHYANNDGDLELIYKFGTDASIRLFQNNQLINNRINDFTYSSISVVKFFNNKPLIIGTKKVYNFSGEPLPLGISYGEFNSLLQFHEYNGIYHFGDFNVKYGIGTSFYVPINQEATGDFLFTNLNYTSSLMLVVKEENSIYG